MHSLQYAELVQDWLQTPSTEWPQHRHYKIIEMFAKEMPTTNDIAERGDEMIRSAAINFGSQAAT